MNPQAAANLMQDFDDTIEILKGQADSLGYCNSERLRKLGFHKVHFQRHKYLFVYRIKGKIVIIEGMYHELQDYENAIGWNMNTGDGNNYKKKVMQAFMSLWEQSEMNLTFYSNDYCLGFFIGPQSPPPGLNA